MNTYVCSTDPDETKRPPPKEVSSTYMRGRWTHHAYSMAHDGAMTIVHTTDGIELVRGTKNIKVPLLLPYNPRDFMWAPDSKRVCFWVPTTLNGTEVRGLAVMDASRIHSTPELGDSPYKIVYAVPGNRQPYGVEWSPKNDCLFVIEIEYEEGGGSYGVIQQVDVDSKRVKQVVRMPGPFDFFMPPVSRFERGEGPSTESYRLIFGHREGLFLVDPDGKNLVKLSEIPAQGLQNIEWNPNPRKNEVILFFRRPVANSKGETFGGAWRVDINLALQAAKDRVGGAAETSVEFAENLHDGLDIHTLWYSPRGTYVTWASENALSFRRPEAKPDTTVVIVAPETDDGIPLPIKGVTWHDKEKLLAYTAGNRCYVYDLDTKKSLLVAEMGKPDTHFLAEPRFVKDQVFVSLFEDMKALIAEQKDKPRFKQAGDTTPFEKSKVPTDPTTRDGALEVQKKRQEEEERRAARAKAEAQTQPPPAPAGGQGR